MSDIVEWNPFWGDEFDLGLTVSIIRGKVWGDVARCFGGDPSSSSLMSAEDADAAQWDFDGEHYLLVKEVNECTIVTFEVRGFSGSLPDVAKCCSSEGAEFISASWDVNSRRCIVHALSGEFCGTFDPGGLEDPLDDIESGDELDCFPGWALRFRIRDGESLSALSIRLIEEKMAIHLDGTWLHDDLIAIKIPNDPG